MRATIKEVAKKAGVSIATVSRVFNKRDLVQDETSEIVEKVARELKYSPNPSARSLSTSRTETISVLLPDLYGEFFSEVIRGMDQTARLHNYNLLISSSHNNRDEIEAALRVMRGRVDGLIIMSPDIDAQTLNTNLPTSLPLVLLNCYVKEDDYDAFNIDNFSGAYQMVKHLIGDGHTRIAILKGTEKNIDAQERLRGYRAALQEASLPILPDLEIPGEFTEASGFDGVQRILSLSPRPTAVFASNDSMAIGAMSALKSYGISLPLDMALAGFDDIPIAEYVNPSLTTVRVGISAMGVMAIERLLEAIRGKNNHVRQQTVLSATPVIRESCGCTTIHRD